MKNKIYFKTDDIEIYNDDFLKTDCIREESIDLVITSPPYNVDIKYNSYNDDINYETYLEFSQKWLAKTFKFLKNDGRFLFEHSFRQK